MPALEHARVSVGHGARNRLARVEVSLRNMSYRPERMGLSNNMKHFCMFP